MFTKAILLLILWTAAYYLAGVFITSEWDTSEWDGAAKAVTLVFIWLPGIIILLMACVEVKRESRND